MATDMTDSACDLERLTEMVFKTQPRQEGTSPEFEFEFEAVAGNNEADLVHLRHYTKGHSSFEDVIGRRISTN